MDDFYNEQGISLKCLNCGSPLEYNPETQGFDCKTCQSSFTEEELSRRAVSFTEQETFDEEFKDYNCPGCGAEILADENTTTEFCVYCGNPVVLKGRVSGQLKPSLIIPFLIDKRKAQEILVNYLSKYSYTPNSFYKESNLEKITGIYYPFWEADINTSSSLDATGTKIKSWIIGDRKYTETSYYKIKRSGLIHFEDISVNALKSADKKLVESVLPYPVKEHIPFKMAYLSGFYSKKNDLSYSDVYGEIKNKLGGYSKSVLENTIGGYNSISVNQSVANILSEKHDYTLLPIWILNYKYRGKNYTYAINGVTGKVFGEVPLSKARLGLTFAGIGASIFAILSMLGGLFL